jgi:hypothetical protein
MRLAEFIKGHGDQILENWEDFARKLSDANLSKWILRDHATAPIDFILQRMDVSSPPVEQRLEAAAKGAESPLRRVAAAHVKLRIDSGFAVAQIIADTARCVPVWCGFGGSLITKASRLAPPR